MVVQAWDDYEIEYDFWSICHCKLSIQDRLVCTIYILIVYGNE